MLFCIFMSVVQPGLFLLVAMISMPSLVVGEEVLVIFIFMGLFFSFFMGLLITFFCFPCHLLCQARVVLRFVSMVLCVVMSPILLGLMCFCLVVIYFVCMAFLVIVLMLVVFVLKESFMSMMSGLGLMMLCIFMPTLLFCLKRLLAMMLCLLLMVDVIFIMLIFLLTFLFLFLGNHVLAQVLLGTLHH